MRQLSPMEIIAAATEAVPVRDELPAPTRHRRHRSPARTRIEPGFVWRPRREREREREREKPPAAVRPRRPARQQTSAALDSRLVRSVRMWNWRRDARLAALALLVLVPLIAWQTGGLDRAGTWIGNTTTDATRGAGLAVHDVLVTGRNRTPQDAVLGALDVRYGTPILSVDLAAAKAKLEALPWIEKAAVERRLPNRLFIQIEERRPVARWRHQGRTYAVDRNGVAIHVRPDAGFDRLPLVTGAGAPDETARLLDLLAQNPKLAARVVEARRIGSRRWDLIFDNGVVVMLPTEDTAGAWKLFVALEAERNLLARGLVAVDLRLADRVVIRAPERVEPQPPRETGKKI